MRNEIDNPHRIAESVLDICGELLSYLRHYPSSRQLIEAVSVIPSLLEFPFEADADNLKIKVLNTLQNIRREPGDHQQIIGYLESKYLTGYGAVRISRSNLEILKLVCVAANRLLIRRDDELTHDFGDAFHGLSFAIRYSELNRSEYFNVYFQPFLSKWDGFLRDEEVQRLKEWSNFGMKIGFRSRIELAQKFAGDMPIKVTQDGSIRDGHYRVEAAKKKHDTVKTEVVP